MKQLNVLIFYLLSALGLLVVRPGYAQDAIPVCPKPDTHSSPVYPSREMKQLMQFVAVDSPMPDVFKNVTENELTDPAGSLYPSVTYCTYRRFTRQRSCFSLCNALLSGR